MGLRRGAGPSRNTPAPPKPEPIEVILTKPKSVKAKKKRKRIVIGKRPDRERIRPVARLSHGKRIYELAIVKGRSTII